MKKVLNIAISVTISFTSILRIKINMKYKHKHGTINPVIEQEEKSILLSVDRALSSSPNAQTIGVNGELPLLKFLNRYLPSTFRAVSGHFITPNGNISPQIDIMILDSRYPLLSENLDGSVLAMLHSVIQTIEVKTNLTSIDIKKIALSISKTRKLMNELDIFDCNNCFTAPITISLAYRIKNKLGTVCSHFQRNSIPSIFHFDLIILRLPKQDFNNKEIGCTLHYEPIFNDEINNIEDHTEIDNAYETDEFMLLTIPEHTPLSDMYYSLVQNGYYILGERNFTFQDIGEHIMSYMSWSTASWEEIFQD